MVIIKKIKPLSFARVSAVFYAVIGFLVSTANFLFLMIRDMVLGIEGNPLSGLAVIIFSSVVISLLTGVIGFFFGFMFAYFYNILSRRIGGIVVVFALEEEEKKKELRDRWTAKGKTVKNEEKPVKAIIKKKKKLLK